MISGLRPILSDSQPATSGIGTENTISSAVHQPRCRFVEAEDLDQVDEREEVDHTEAAPAAAERRGEVEPAQVAVAQDPPERLADAAARQRRRPVRAALADEEQDRDADRDGRQPEHDRGAAPADRRDERNADQCHDHRANVPARDVGADREAAPFGRELLGQQAVADRVLRRAADARRDVRDGEASGSRWPEPGPPSRHRTGSRRTRAAGGARRSASGRRS